MPAEGPISVEDCPSSVKFHCRRDGLAPPGELQKLMCEALPVFKKELAHLLQVDDVWYIVEKSGVELVQMLVPRTQLLSHLAGNKTVRRYATTTLANLREPVGPLFVRWVAVVQRKGGLGIQLASGRVVRSQIDATA